MKKYLLTIILACFVLNSFGQKFTDPLDPTDKWFAKDKANHLMYGTVGTIMVTGVYYGLGWKNYQIAGAATSFTIGLGKEYLFDKRPSGMDMTANFIAVCIGSYIAKQSCERWSNPAWQRQRMQNIKLNKKYTVTNAIQP